MRSGTIGGFLGPLAASGLMVLTGVRGRLRLRVGDRRAGVQAGRLQ
jgi:hypothetical protein